jgi:hypothetical protein
MPDVAASRKRQILGCGTLNAINDSSPSGGGAQPQFLAWPGFVGSIRW